MSKGDVMRMSKILFNYDYEASCISEFLDKSKLNFVYYLEDPQVGISDKHYFSLEVEEEILDEKFFRGLTWFLFLVNINMDASIRIQDEDLSEVEERILICLKSICDGTVYTKNKNIVGHLYRVLSRHHLQVGNSIHIIRCDVDTLDGKVPTIGFDKEETDELLNMFYLNTIFQDADSLNTNFGSYPETLMTISELTVDDTNLSEIYLQSYSNYLAINLKVITMVNTRGTVIVNTDNADNARLVVNELYLKYSEISVVDFNESTLLASYRYAMSILPTVPILRTCTSYYQEPDDASHVQLIPRRIVNKLSYLNMRSYYGPYYDQQRDEEERLLIKANIMQRYSKGLNRHLTGAFIICYDRDTYSKLINLKCSELNGIYVAGVRLAHSKDKRNCNYNEISNCRLYLTASTLNILDGEGLLSLTRNSIEEMHSHMYTPYLRLDPSAPPKGVSSILDSTDPDRYALYQIHSAESDNMRLVSDVGAFLKQFDYVWYQSGIHCKTVAGSYAIQCNCQDMIGN